MPPATQNSSAEPRPDAFHILVVDDEDGIRNSLCELIEIEGYRVTGVSSAREALQCIQDASVNLVITDLMMPEISGWQLLRAIKKKGIGIPVVVLTGYIPEQGKSILTDQQADGYLTKPVDHRRLQGLLNSLLLPHHRGQAAQVVVIDDDASALQAVGHTLGRLDLQVATFQDPGEALEHIRATLPNLAIVDLNIPNFSGFEICQIIRSDPRIAHILILILTADPSRENVQKALALGVTGFTAKPFEPRALREKVQQILRQAGHG